MQPSGNGTDSFCQLIARQKMKHIGSMHGSKCRWLKVDLTRKASRLHQQLCVPRLQCAALQLRQVASIQIIGNHKGTSSQRRQSGSPKGCSNI